MPESKASMVSGNILDNGLIRVVIDKQTGDIISLTERIMQNLQVQVPDTRINSYRYLHGDDNPEKASGTTECENLCS